MDCFNMKQTMRIRFIWHQCTVCMVALMVLSSCASDRMILPNALPDPTAAPAVHASGEQDRLQADGEQRPAPDLQRIPVIRHSLSAKDKSVAAELELPDKMLILNADGLPLLRFIDMALGEVLGLNYEIDPVFSTRRDAVTLHITQPVTAKRLLEMVESTLLLYRAGLSSDNGIVKVVPVERIRSNAPLINFARRASNAAVLGRIIEFIPLYYIDFNEAITLSRMFIDTAGGEELKYFMSLNAIAVIARPASVRQFREVLALVDRPSMGGVHVHMLRPVYWQADILKKTLSKMLQAQGVPVVSSGKDRNKGVLMISIPVLNALMVISPQQVWLDAVNSLTATLDVPEAAGSGKQSFVYFVRNSRAVDLGNVISQVLGQGGISAAAASPSAAPAAISSAVHIDGLKGLSVIVDDKMNALIFVGEAGAYRAMQSLLKQLDRIPRQVLIEVTVAEITLDNSQQLGIEWQFDNINTSNTLTGTLGTLGGLGLGAGGLTYALLNNAGLIKAKLNALASSGRSKILSTPRILAMDGEQAKIQVGDQIPVVSQEVSQVSAAGATGVGVVRSFDYIDTGVILSLTPTINEGGMVQIDLSQEVSEVGQGNAGANPPIFKRNISTKMVARSGQTIALGGMIRHTLTKRENKVPFFGDLPIIGSLFKTIADADRATELLVLITPHVLTSSADAAFITDAMRKELHWQNATLPYLKGAQ